MKKPKELDENLLSDLFHAATPERKVRKPAIESKETDIEEDEYFRKLQEKKRARYEALKKKAEEY